MEGGWIGFSALLGGCWAATLLALALKYLWKLDLRRAQSILPLLLLAAGLYQHAALARFAARCQTVLMASPPGLFLSRSLDLPLS